VAFSLVGICPKEKVMSDDILLVKLERRRWITDGPLDVIVARYVQYLREQRYSSLESVAATTLLN
jgi:hypothetical protein